ncbi:MAG: hypothetical protein V4539_16805 [Bacteroidota bacterium]
MTSTVKTTPTTKRGKLVGTKHVNHLVSNYKKERWIQNSQNLGKMDSLSTWYGLDELQSFMQLAKQHQADGIKMYYGVYGEDFEGEPELQGRQTIVLVATKQKKTGAGIVNKEIYVHKESGSEILAFNYGTLCPPFCAPPGEEGYGLGFDMSGIGLSIIEKNGHIIIA